MNINEKLDDALKKKWKYDQERVKLCPVLESNAVKFIAYELTERDLLFLRLRFTIYLRSDDGMELLKNVALNEAVDLAVGIAVEDLEDSFFGIDIHTF